MDSKLKGNKIELGIQTPVLQKISPCPPNPSSFGWSPIRLSPPPQQIGLFISPFCARCLRQTQKFPSGRGVYTVHGSTMRQASFAVSIKLRCYRQEVGRLAFTSWQRAGRPSPWGVSRLRINKNPGVRLHLRLYLKILFLINFLYLICFIMFLADYFVLMVYIVYWI